MRRKNVKSPLAKGSPTNKDVELARRLAKQVSKLAIELFEAKGK